MEELMKEFYACPKCGTAICGEKRKYFICPECGRALCEESKLEGFDDNYCGNCGTKIIRAREKALALVGKMDDTKLENWISVILPKNCPNICISFKREVAQAQIEKFKASPLYGFDRKEDWLPIEVFITYGGELAPNQKHPEL